MEKYKITRLIDNADKPSQKKEKPVDYGVIIAQKTISEEDLKTQVIALVTKKEDGKVQGVYLVENDPPEETALVLIGGKRYYKTKEEQE